MKIIYGVEGEWLFYVRNTKDVIKYDVRKKTATLVGSCRDSVLSLVIILN